MDTSISINRDLCKKCLTCTEICPNVIFIRDQEAAEIRQERVNLCIKCGQCMAACRDKAIQISGLDYERDFFDLPEIINSFDALIQTRRSIRAFKDKPVPADILEQIATAASFAPPSFPPHKTEITIIKDKETVRKSLPYMVDLYENLMKRMKKPVQRFFIERIAGEEQYKLLRNHIVPMFSVKMPFMKAGTEDAITRNAQALMLFHSDGRSENYNTDIFIALTYALLKAHTLGIGATVNDLIPHAVDKSPELRKMFKIPTRNVVVASLVLGYPKYRYRRGIKRQFKSVTWI
ncbi:MAG TPA: nitroreductase family protein [Bacteroidales bacterium]|nr:nitroreductase family protein [Bacteroidales bacterium]